MQRSLQQACSGSTGAGGGCQARAAMQRLPCKGACSRLAHAARVLVGAARQGLPCRGCHAKEPAAGLLMQHGSWWGLPCKGCHAEAAMQKSPQQACSCSTVTLLPAQRNGSRLGTMLCDAAQVQGCLSCCRSGANRGSMQVFQCGAGVAMQAQTARAEDSRGKGWPNLPILDTQWGAMNAELQCRHRPPVQQSLHECSDEPAPISRYMTGRSSARMGCTVAELTNPTIRAARYWEAMSCKMPVSVSLQGHGAGICRGGSLSLCSAILAAAHVAAQSMSATSKSSRCQATPLSREHSRCSPESWMTAKVAAVPASQQLC